jgi:acyl CoA:acetate/3-ketoacid CoA transferase beta subunit
LEELTSPVTALAAVDLVITDIAVIEVTDRGLVLKEIAPGGTPDEVQALTRAPLRSSADLKEMEPL